MKKTEKIVLLVFSLILVFTLGFGVGRRSRSGDVLVVTQKNETAPDTVRTEATEQTEDRSASTQININTADVEQLALLPGIGEVLAGRIVAYRKAHGPFEKVSELMEVQGIGQGKLDAVKDMIKVK